MIQSQAILRQPSSTPIPPRPAPLPAGGALIRLLGVLNAAPGAVTRAGFAERMSRWFAWLDAVTLADALVAAPPVSDADPAGAADVDARRVRTLLDRIADDPASAQRFGRTADQPPATDFATHRERYAAAQREMAVQIAGLRERLRAALARRSPAMATLAALDAVMERVVGAREQHLLAGVPRRLAPRFEQLRAADAASDGAARFAHDLRVLLRAELDLRWQPVDALLHALSPSPA